MSDFNAASLSPTEALVAQAMAAGGKRVDLATITRDTAMSQDAGIDGIDVWEFVAALGEEHRHIWYRVPWQRFSDQRASFYGWSIIMFPFWLLWRLVTWPLHREWPIPPLRQADERLTVGHLAAVLDRGDWFEPGETAG